MESLSGKKKCANVKMLRVKIQNIVEFIKKNFLQCKTVL